MTSYTVQNAYPLVWPMGWPRTRVPTASRFGDRSTGAALDELKKQLKMSGATDLVISSNYTLGVSPTDKGVCIYFRYKSKPYALPCDKWNRLECNLWALGKHVESVRLQERWGVGTLERAFAGYLALPSSAGANPDEWWTVLGVERSATLDQVNAAFREKARTAHPDVGGTDSEMSLLNAALAAAKLSFGL